MTVVWSRVKSSAVSVSSFPGLARRDAAPIRPSGLPVVKENGADHRDVATHIPNASLAPLEHTNDRIILVFVTILYFLRLQSSSLLAVTIMSDTANDVVRKV